MRRCGIVLQKLTLALQGFEFGDEVVRPISVPAFQHVHHLNRDSQSLCKVSHGHFQLDSQVFCRFLDFPVCLLEVGFRCFPQRLLLL